MNRFAHKHARNKAGKPQIMPARAKRKRTWMAVSLGNTEDNLACLRGPVNGGAEKREVFELSEIGLYLNRSKARLISGFLRA